MGLHGVVATLSLWRTGGFNPRIGRQNFAPGVMVALQVSIERYAREAMREVQVRILRCKKSLCAGMAKVLFRTRVNGGNGTMVF